MINLKFSSAFVAIILGIAILFTGCGTLEIGIETPISPTLLHETNPTEEIIIPSATPPPTAVPEPTSPANKDGGEIPDLVSLGHLAPFGSHDIGLIVVQDEEVTVESSPVDFGLFWGYSPQTLRMIAPASVTCGYTIIKPAAQLNGWKTMSPGQSGLLMVNT
jgi:hypothetical protein